MASADGAVEEGEVCIVGAGPAGLTLACELSERGRDVILVESGTNTADPDAQALNDGRVIGDDYAGLRETRHRQLGGTTCLWNTPVQGQIGAKYAPLDAIDFDGRPYLGVAGWPISREALHRHYARAQELCGLGPFRYDAADWRPAGAPALPTDGATLAARVYQLGTREALTGAKLRQLRAAGNVRLWRHTTALRLLAGRGRCVDGVEVASAPDRRWRVRARHVVLAGGAVENARLLLVSGDGPEGLGNASGRVGRGFMEHPRDGALLLRPASARAWRELAFFDVHAAPDGTVVLGRLALHAALLRADALPNASATLLAVPSARVQAWRRRLGPIARHAGTARWLPPGGHGWSHHPAPERVYDGWTVWLNVEQLPRGGNRVVLGTARDAFGVPRAELHWRWRAEQERHVERVRERVTSALEDMGVGRVHARDGVRPDANAHHHAGTTRMHADPRHGVVDADCRVHALDNLWVAGASVFPTAGFANPVLTVVALAARLAERLDDAR